MKAGQSVSSCIHQFETSAWEEHRALGIAEGRLDLIMGNKSHLRSASTEAQWLISFLWFLISIITMKAFLAQLILQGWTLLKTPSEDTHPYGRQYTRHWSSGQVISERVYLLLNVNHLNSNLLQTPKSEFIWIQINLWSNQLQSRLGKKNNHGLECLSGLMV